jgi:predicted PolB exonuclease-like 3'-5' exonuclease
MHSVTTHEASADMQLIGSSENYKEIGSDSKQLTYSYYPLNVDCDDSNGDKFSESFLSYCKKHKPYMKLPLRSLPHKNLKQDSNTKLCNFGNILRYHDDSGSFVVCRSSLANFKILRTSDDEHTYFCENFGEKIPF